MSCLMRSDSEIELINLMVKRLDDQRSQIERKFWILDGFDAKQLELVEAWVKSFRGQAYVSLKPKVAFKRPASVQVPRLVDLKWEAWV